MPDTVPQVDCPRPTETSPIVPDAASPDQPQEKYLFEFTDERRFQLYVERRKRYSDGAREAYQRFHQTIVGLSAGLIILSMSFLKDIGHAPDSLLWLLASWGFVLLGSLVAIFALITSGEADRERIIQIDCLAQTSACDESKAIRLGRITVWFNYLSATLCIIGVLCMVVFATKNVLQLGDTTWQKEEKTAPPSPAQTPRKTNVLASTNPPATRSSTETAKPESSQREPIPETPSQRP